MPSGDNPTSGADVDAQLDVNVLKEIAKKDLVDALNSVSLFVIYFQRTLLNMRFGSR